jgi:cytochrome P450
MNAPSAAAIAARRRELVADAARLPLAEFDVSQAKLFSADAIWPYFARLRQEDPVHYCPDSAFGPYWSITRYDDIVEIERDVDTFSSEPTILIGDPQPDFQLPMFIAMDPPRHDVQRRTVQPVVSRGNLDAFESIIRRRAGRILDALPAGETFDWVERVSIELTTQMLATLFDFPFEERHRLTHWSDIAIATPATGADGMQLTEEARRAALMECLEVFTGLWNERASRPPGNDLVSMLAHGPETQDMAPLEYLGNILLLIIGGNDTTRNSISGGVLALNQFPGEYDKLRANPGLVPNMVGEIIRWQTPLAHMRRRATRDVEFRGRQIRREDRVVLWYVSANRDESAFDAPDQFRIDRKLARRHLSFGHGIHRCMGSRLAEMQLTIVWEEILKRFHTVEVVGDPVRTHSNFVKGFVELPVRVHPH